MTPKPFDITGRRLAGQHLTKPTLRDSVEIVRRLGAVQAQDYAGGKWGVGLRGKGVTDAMVEQALDAGTIIRTHVLRPTWHLMAASDARWILALTGPRVHAANSHYCRKMGLDDATFTRSAKAIAKALVGGKHLTREELAGVLQRAGIETGPAQRLAYLMMHAELNALICSGPRRGKQFTYGLFDERVPSAPPLDRDEALAELARRFFSTRGPATLHDFAWWSGLTKTDAKKAVAILGAEFERYDVDDKQYLFGDGPTPRATSAPAVYLLPNYDEYFIGFTDRSAILDVLKGFSLVPGDPRFAAHVIVLNGQLVGGWKRTHKPKTVIVEPSLVPRLKPDERRALATAAARYGEFLELPVDLRS